MLFYKFNFFNVVVRRWVIMSYFDMFCDRNGTNFFTLPPCPIHSENSDIGFVKGLGLIILGFGRTSQVLFNLAPPDYIKSIFILYFNI